VRRPNLNPDGYVKARDRLLSADRPLFDQIVRHRTHQEDMREMASGAALESASKTARMAGILYLGMMPLAIFTLWVRSTVSVPGDGAATARHVLESEAWLRAAILTWLGSQTLFIFLLLALYRLLAPVNGRQAMLMVVLGLVGVPIAFVNELCQFAALLLVSGADYLRAFETAQLQAAVPFVLRLHDHGLYIAHVFWGLWLVPLGCLVFRSGFLPRILGALLILAGAGYLVDCLRYVLMPDVAAPVTQFTAIGELLFPLWLLLRGVNVRRSERQAEASV
jgi:hypothetical protein